MRLLLIPRIHQPASGIPSLPDLERLAAWLEASGDFVQESLRVRSCIADCSAQSQVHDALREVCALTDWFDRRSNQCLAAYTGDIPTYLSGEHQTRRNNEDYLSTGRTQVEYHLNMVGAEILNDAFCRDFQARKRRIVALPACMRVRNGEACGAKETSLGLQCIRCNPHCAVNRIVSHAGPVGLEVFVIRHSSSYLQWLQHPEVQSEAAIIGVACVPNLLTGGWEAKAAGVPAQCVLLDHAGCVNHWHAQGLATDLNILKLIELGAPGAFTSPETKRSAHSGLATSRL